MFGADAECFLLGWLAQAIGAREHLERLELYDLGAVYFTRFAYQFPRRQTLIGRRRIIHQYARQRIRIKRERGGLWWASFQAAMSSRRSA